MSSATQSMYDQLLAQASANAKKTASSAWSGSASAEQLEHLGPCDSIPGAVVSMLVIPAVCHVPGSERLDAFCDNAYARAHRRMMYSFLGMKARTRELFHHVSGVNLCELMMTTIPDPLTNAPLMRVFTIIDNTDHQIDILRAASMSYEFEYAKALTRSKLSHDEALADPEKIAALKAKTLFMCLNKAKNQAAYTRDKPHRCGKERRRYSFTRWLGALMDCNTIDDVVMTMQMSELTGAPKQMLHDHLEAYAPLLELRDRECYMDTLDITTHKLLPRVYGHVGPVQKQAYSPGNTLSVNAAISKIVALASGYGATTGDVLGVDAVEEVVNEFYTDVTFEPANAQGQEIGFGQFLAAGHLDGQVRPSWCIPALGERVMNRFFRDQDGDRTTRMFTLPRKWLSWTRRLRARYCTPSVFAYLCIPKTGLRDVMALQLRSYLRTKNPDMSRNGFEQYSSRYGRQHNDDLETRFGQLRAKLVPMFDAGLRDNYGAMTGAAFCMAWDSLSSVLYDTNQMLSSAILATLRRFNSATQGGMDIRPLNNAHGAFRLTDVRQMSAYARVVVRLTVPLSKCKDFRLEAFDLFSLILHGALGSACDCELTSFILALGPAAASKSYAASALLGYAAGLEKLGSSSSAMAETADHNDRTGKVVYHDEADGRLFNTPKNGGHTDEERMEIIMMAEAGHGSNDSTDKVKNILKELLSNTNTDHYTLYIGEKGTRGLNHTSIHNAHFRLLSGNQLRCFLPLPLQSRAIIVNMYPIARDPERPQDDTYARDTSTGKSNERALTDVNKYGQRVVMFVFLSHILVGLGAMERPRLGCISQFLDVVTRMVERMGGTGREDRDKEKMRRYLETSAFLRAYATVFESGVGGPACMYKRGEAIKMQDLLMVPYVYVYVIVSWNPMHSSQWSLRYTVWSYRACSISRITSST